MLRPRVMPVLLMRDGGLVKTRRFGEYDYIGDPINTVKVFNEKLVDELVFLDIDATTMGKEPNYSLISKLASEARMPLCYGGGIKSVEQASRVVGLGVEKIAVSSGMFSDKHLVVEMSEQLGSQSVVGVLDVKKKFGRYCLVVNNGKDVVKGWKLRSAIEWLQTQGIGELLLNSVDQDGLMTGYDLELIAKVRPHIHVPLTVVGGVGSFEHIAEMISRFGLTGAGAGSFFVFKGAYRAVLISYLDDQQKNQLLEAAYLKQGLG